MEAGDHGHKILHKILMYNQMCIRDSSKAIKELLSEPLFSTMEELEMINKNKNRKKGRNETVSYTHLDQGR